jgi:hypothetical protein
VSELKAKWIEALRSGAYRQGRGQLKFGDRYCCLGVLCKVMGVEFDACDNPIVEKDSCYKDYLPLDEDDIEKLWRMNDAMVDGKRPNTFSDIADFIETSIAVAPTERT